jgi:hypothetical protein
MNEPCKILPYWNPTLGTWVFDDATVGLEDEPFVKGFQTIIDQLVADIPSAREGFCLLFADTPFPGFQRTLTQLREDDGGAWYRLDGSDLEGWLCPALFKYFSEAPPTLYMKAEPVLRRQG